ncbi:DUF7266 family protein [Halosegnis marinus]|uniref:Uncharacterized protein n=1 Tax=Halosegnis marinus TaxID=3034023 RepID=A0ABD5ZRL5_9EURY|nr:hypothetical protein [Halosegnis sp. DT85]
MSERGVSTVVGFVLTLGITSLLIIGLLIAAGGFVSDQRQDTVRDELEVIGQQVAADLAASDRLTRAGGTEVGIARSYPRTVTGSGYQVRVSDPGTPGERVRVTLTADDPAVTVVVDVRVRTPVRATTVRGGDLTVALDAGELEVRND